MSGQHALLPIAAALGARDIVRLTTHPLVVTATIVSIAWAAIPAVRDSTVTSMAPGTALNIYLILAHSPSFLVGPATLFAANLLATRERRAGTGALLTAAPVSVRTRTVSLLLAPLGPAILTTVTAAVQVAAFRALGPAPSRWPTAYELATQPATVIGAGLLGVMVARWLPYPGATAITMFILAASFTTTANLGRDTWLSFAPWRDLVITDEHNNILGYFPGTVAWHVAYLLCLGAMAATAALLATPGPRRGLIAAGLVAVLAAAGTGWAQLP